MSYSSMAGAMLSFLWLHMLMNLHVKKISCIGRVKQRYTKAKLVQSTGKKAANSNNLSFLV